MSHEAILKNIKTRRVVRDMTDEPVEREQIERILDAARWAPNGGNQRIHRFVVIEDPQTLRLIRMVSPGMFQRAPVLLLICIDWAIVDENRLPHTDRAIYIDVGTAAQTMMLAAHAQGLASGPVTSFSQAAVQVILNMPEQLSPEMFICVGHAAPGKKQGMKSRKKTTWQDLTYWERFE
jgi:nitroreductase